MSKNILKKINNSETISKKTYHNVKGNHIKIENNSGNVSIGGNIHQQK